MQCRPKQRSPVGVAGCFSNPGRMHVCCSECVCVSVGDFTVVNTCMCPAGCTRCSQLCFSAIRDQVYQGLCLVVAPV
jgi:hypothetical protein